ncbi:hypothetical protein KC331_g16381 [Hortaea werneckii]|nr:hypothetical protein KC331_g16381 [Hortaea werneckii]KAI7692143.1 hypothetical protein KC353_g18771 [Hortaea werneckii]
MADQSSNIGNASDRKRKDSIPSLKLPHGVRKKVKIDDAWAGEANRGEHLEGKSDEEIFETLKPSLEQAREELAKQYRENKTDFAVLPDCGVYVAKPFCMNETVSMIAGYLNCPSTAVLWERFYDAEEVRNILEKLASQMKKVCVSG